MSTVTEPSLTDILADPEWMKVFSTFLRRRFCFENLDFYMAAIAYEEIDDASSRAEKAMEIWMRFLDSDAASPLNIDDSAKNNIETHLSLAEKDLFSESKGQIFELLRCDSYRSFISSKIYKDYVSHLSAPETSSIPFHDGTLTRSGNWNYYRQYVSSALLFFFFFFVSTTRGQVGSNVALDVFLLFNSSVKIESAVRDKIIIGSCTFFPLTSSPSKTKTEIKT